tara:strand:+ start:329 stop:499 length:171 start_codon:yes stop_codon:yes gene_type:complete
MKNLFIFLRDTSWTSMIASYGNSAWIKIKINELYKTGMIFAIKFTSLKRKEKIIYK